MLRHETRWSWKSVWLSMAMVAGWGFGCTADEETPRRTQIPGKCKAGVLLEGSELEGQLQRVSQAGSPAVRLLDEPSRIEGAPRQTRSASAERRGAQAIGRWKVVETPLGPRRRSGAWKTSIDRAGVLMLEIEANEVESIDVTVVPNGRTLNEIEQFHRTVRLDLTDAMGATQKHEVELEPLLRGTWRDGQSSGVTHFQVELDATLPVDAIRRVEVRTKRSRYEKPGAQTIAGPPGSLRPSLQLPSGVSWVVPVEAAEHSRRLVLHLFAPIGTPRLSVRFSDDPRGDSSWMVPSAGWKRYALRIPPDAEGELRFEATGSGVVLLGDPTLWSPSRQVSRPDVIVYMIDTLLASRVGALGSSVPGVSPIMDSLVKRGLVFVRATSTSPWTKPAIASLMTGVYPLTHRVGTRNYTDRLTSRAPLLQERFRDAGFRTISASASPLGSTLSGLERGFDLAHPPVRWENELGPLGHPEARQIQSALWRFIDEDPSRPVFAYLHTLDVHEHHRPMFAEGVPNDAAPYDRAIRHQDEALGALLREYQERKRDMILVLVSDHGEGFGEYGIEPGHGYSLRQNQLHGPLVFFGPKWLPRGRVAEPASLVDVAPTLLDLFSLAPLPRAQGRSLLPGQGPAPPAVYAERSWFLWDHRGPRLSARIAADGSKLVSGRSVPSFWDLKESPCEDRAHAKPKDLGAHLDLVKFEREQAAAASSWEAAYGESAPGRINPDDVARLRALGYLQ